MRYHAHYHTSGQGHVYQQRYKSFPIQDDAHFFVVCRYVERNALRAGLVSRAEDWRWGSLWRWRQSPEPTRSCFHPGPYRVCRTGWSGLTHRLPTLSWSRSGNAFSVADH